jgi:nicotinic acid mononucleotide adenylyltransferase
MQQHLWRMYRRTFFLLEGLPANGEARAVLATPKRVPAGQVIVFPGSFNPPTTAHLAMLRQARAFARSRGGTWSIYAALSKRIVDKEQVERMTILDRVVLLERLVKSELHEVGVMLLNRGLYVEQAQAIQQSFPQVRQLYFLLGYDKLVQIFDPRYYSERESTLRELFARARLLVAPRGSEGEQAIRQLLARPENRPYAWAVHPLALPAAYRAISSSQVRQRSAEASAILPPLVQAFLANASPYEQPQQDASGGTRDIYAERTQALQQAFSAVYDGT